jgi:predicted amino acid dehydrogenase
LQRADVIFSASNSAVPVVEAQHVAASRKVLVCDVAVPADVSPMLAQQRPLALVIRGGVAKLPTDQTFQLPGFSLVPGETYACAAETLLLGLAGISSDFSRGVISTAQVREVLELARLHGFRLASYKRDQPPASAARASAVACEAVYAQPAE